MDWLKEVLDEEKYSKVTELLGDVKILPSDGSYIPKNKFDDINNENKMLREKVTSYEKNSIEVEKIVGTNKEMQEQLKKLQETHLQEISLKEKELKNIVKTSAIKELLMQEKAIYPDLLMSQIDLEKVNIIDGKVDFNVAELKTKYSNMFQNQVTESAKPGNAGVKPQATTTREALIEKYNNAEKVGNVAEMMTLNSQIKKLQE